MSDDLDDFTQSINIIPVRTKVIKTTNTARGEEIEKMLSQAIRQTDKHIFFEPSCPICASSNRKDIEQKYQDVSGKGTSQLLEVKKFIKDTYGTDLEVHFIENHFLMHFNQGVREQQKVEYSRVVRQLYNQSLTTLDKVGLAFAIVTERIIAINSLTPTHNESVADIERLKSVETTKLLGTYNNLLKLQATLLGEMKNDGKLLSFPRDEFISIFEESILSANSDEEKKMLTNLLEKLTILAGKAQ